MTPRTDSPIADAITTVRIAPDDRQIVLCFENLKTNTKTEIKTDRRFVYMLVNNIERTKIPKSTKRANDLVAYLHETALSHAHFIRLNN